ncbi:MAG: hypothetical protein LBG87_05660 [Spirochaetaceae bacterium]|jgi:hypothetical protein|nr:hypothetical protein [Spirochaetaceae bacterium]
MKLMVVAAMLAAAGAMLTAQETSGLERFGLAGTLSLGAGAEMNQYTDRSGFALGEMIHLGYGFRPDISAGIRVLFSQNFGDYFTLVPAAFFRWYPLALGPVLLFAQAEAGGAVIFSGNGFENAAFDSGAGLGARIPLRLFYAEAYARYGYSGGFAFGIAGGLALKVKQ